MLRPDIFKIPHVSLRNTPYLRVDGKSSPEPFAMPLSGGVLGAGELIWTQDSDPLRDDYQQVMGYSESAGTILFDPHGLVLADVLGESGGFAVETPKKALAPERRVYNPADEEIARVAYRRWRERGDGEGNPEQDWADAEGELRALGPQTEK